MAERTIAMEKSLQSSTINRLGVCFRCISVHFPESGNKYHPSYFSVLFIENVYLKTKSNRSMQSQLHYRLLTTAYRISPHFKTIRLIQFSPPIYLPSIHSPNNSIMQRNGYDCISRTILAGY